MKKVLLSLMGLAAVSFTAQAQKAKAIQTAAKPAAAAPAKAEASTWGVDVSHTSINFSVAHMVISETTGKFKAFEGSVESPSSDFNNAKINFTVDVNSINTDDEKRDGHLKSDDFFNAEKYPKMTFASKSFQKIKGNKYKLVGDLTIRDVTKPVTFDVVYGGTVKDPWGNTKAGFKLTGKINRKEYGLKWTAALEAGGAVVGDEVSFNANIELAKK